MRQFGLIGFPLSHSFSGKYFTEKFAAEGITDASYRLFELPDIGQLPILLAENPDLCGLNVTIPHKQSIISYLDFVDPVAARIGAVNVVKISDGKLLGFNSDHTGFLKSLERFYPGNAPALVLGTGGASKAVQAALEQLNIPFRLVSRESKNGSLSYSELSADIMNSSLLIINTTPLGTFPDVDTCPPIPYQFLASHHYLFDLVYNPAETLFLKQGKLAGAHTKNGYEMLCLQAEEAWEIWNR